MISALCSTSDAFHANYPRNVEILMSNVCYKIRNKYGQRKVFDRSPVFSTLSDCSAWTPHTLFTAIWSNQDQF